MMVAAITVVVTSMSMVSCNNDDDTVDTFRFNVVVTQGNMTSSEYTALKNIVAPYQNLLVGTGTKGDAVRAFDEAIAIVDGLMSEETQNLKDKGYKDFSVTLQLVGDELGVVASKTWK